MSECANVGIVGCGLVTTLRHLPAFRKLKRSVTIQAVCDMNKDIAAKVAGQYGIPRVYENFSEMLDRERLDVVDICTPPHTHKALAVEAAGHGCHVLLEKPMALTTEDCDQMIKAAENQDLKLCVVHNQLFHPPIAKARELVTKGKIGTLTGLTIFVSDPRNEVMLQKDNWAHRLRGGILEEAIPHPIYISLAFLENIQSVDIWAKNFGEHSWAPFDEFRIELEGKDAMASIVKSYTSKRRMTYVHLLGTEGDIYADLLGMLLIYEKPRPSMKPLKLAMCRLDFARRITQGVIANGCKMITGHMSLGHDVVISKFIESIKDGREPPITGWEGRETIRVVNMLINRLHEKYPEAWQDMA